MKAFKNRIIRLLAICVLFLSAFTGYAFAGSSNEEMNAEITVSCMKYSGSKGEAYIVEIEGEDKASPLPKDNILNIKEDGSGSFEIKVSEPGTYSYKIYQKPGEDENIEYDDTVFHVTVFVTQENDGSLKYYVAATAGESGEKPNAIEFVNKTKDNSGNRESLGPDEPPVKTGDENNIPAYAVIAVIMVVVFIILLITRKKGNDSEDEEDEENDKK